MIFERQRRRASRWLLRSRFMRLQRSLRPSLFIDVGAYDADAAREVRRLLPNTRVVAFEANPANYSRFSRQCDFAAERIEYVHAAVGAAKGRTEFYLWGQAPEGTSIKSSILPRSKVSVPQPTVEVDMVSLDDFFGSSISGRVSLWIDAEGASGPVLQGARQILRSTDCVHIEVETEPQWAEQWLAPDVTRYLAEYGLEPVAADMEYPHQHNVLFSRRPAVTSSLRAAGPSVR